MTHFEKWKRDSDAIKPPEFTVDLEKFFQENPAGKENWSETGTPGRLQLDARVWDGLLGVEGTLGVEGCAYFGFMCVPVAAETRHQLWIFYENGSNLYNSGEVVRRLNLEGLDQEQYANLTGEPDIEAAWEVLWELFVKEFDAREMSSGH